MLILKDFYAREPLENRIFSAYSAVTFLIPRDFPSARASSVLL
jgi:hypothetical protein